MLFTYKTYNALADLGGACPVQAPITGPNSFVFACIFGKSARIRGPHPPNGSTPSPTGNPGSATAMVLETRLFP